MASDVKKVVLAYSGGLDTSTILKWVQTTYGCEVVTFTADLGQGEELEAARKKAELLGINESAYRVRLTRARKRLENYLTPRCQHIDAQNPCNCEGRLSVALDKGFIGFPPNLDDIPHTPHVTEVEHREMGSLYRSLPRIALTELERDQLLDLGCPPVADAADEVPPLESVG